MESSRAFALWMVIKQNHFNCRREFVNASTAKLTAKEKAWQVVKRLLNDGGRNKPSKLPSAGVWQKISFALIKAYCFGKRNAFLLPFAAMGKRKCPAAA